MPKLLIVAATPAEITPLLDYYKVTVPNSEALTKISERADVLITGVGMVNTAYILGKFLSNEYDLIINAGICGAFDKQLKIGETVNIIEDLLIEMGAEDGSSFIPYHDLNLGGTNLYKNTDRHGYKVLNDLKAVRSVTVNKVHGNEESIRKTLALYNADVESMEGAAFLRACEGNKTPCLQLRTVSNYVEKRDRSKWNIPLALKNLNEILIRIIEELK